MHNVTVVRSVTHKYPIHGVAYATTGGARHRRGDGTEPARRRGTGRSSARRSSHLEQRKNPASRRKPVPDNIALPLPFSSQRTGEVQRAGPYPAFLGSQFNPHFTAVPRQGEPRRSPRRSPTEHHRVRRAVRRHRRRTPYFTLGGEGGGRHHARPGEHAQVAARPDGRRPPRSATRSTRSDPFREMAYSLIGSEKVRQALDVRREPAQDCARATGTSLFGQSCLAARRLVEAGSQVRDRVLGRVRPGRFRAGTRTGNTTRGCGTN